MKKTVRAVQLMQDYIEENIDKPISLDDLAKISGYTNHHTSKLFKELTGKSPTDYIRARRLTLSALKLGLEKINIINLAFDNHFETPEGFTRAFKKQFGINPKKYEKTLPPIPLFTKRSARDYYLSRDYFFLKNRKDSEMEKNYTVFIQEQIRPKRKFIYKKGIKATNYWEYCDEVSCDIWGVLLSIKGALYPPVGAWLPDSLRETNESIYVQGVEVPLDFNGEIPEGYDVIVLPEFYYLEFNGESYGAEEMEGAIESVIRVIKNYDMKKFGYSDCSDKQPRFQYEPIPEDGYIECIPVSKV